MTERELVLLMDDPNWSDRIPDLRSGGPKCRLVAHEDCIPLDLDAVQSHLMPGGTLGTMPGYEARSGQLEMLRAVTHVFNVREHLMVEAGTGVGKSLAYLIPVIHWAAVNDTPVVISTATRNLQGQLMAQDIPRAVSTLPEPASFRVALLKGRANYFCLHAYAEILRDGYYALDVVARRELVAVTEWLLATKDGDLDTLEVEGVADSSAMRARYSCSGEDCGGRRCPYNGKCFVRKARERALHAHLIVANHALVLAESSNPSGGLLPPFGRVVFDEAHDLEDAATEFFSFEFSRASFVQLMGKLARTTKRGKTARPKGLLGTIERQLYKGALASIPQAPLIAELSKKARVEVSFALRKAEEVFELLRHLFEPAPNDDLIRYRRRGRNGNEEDPDIGPIYGDNMPLGPRQYSRHGLFADYTEAQWNETALDDGMMQLEHHLARLGDWLVDLGELLNAASDDGLPLFADLVAQATGLAEVFREYLNKARFALAGDDPAHVYWAEKIVDHSARRVKNLSAVGWSVAVKSAPLSVARELRAAFWDTKDSAVLASATLRVGESFAYIARKLGLDGERVKFLMAESPFDYTHQVCALTAGFLPDPAAGEAVYVEALAPLLTEIFTESGGRGLVLFTSYVMMRATAEAVRKALGDRGIGLLVQGDGLTREGMTARLKQAHKSSERLVLFGSQSFWEGVDVPGDALGCVVIARLPFPMVGEPITEARCEKIRQAGGTPFRDYMLPEALIKFKQGFGRLVRSRGDRGTVIIADSRAATKNYGAIFRRSVAASFSGTESVADVIERMRAFSCEQTSCLSSRGDSFTGPVENSGML